MGVKGLWKLLDATGKPIPVEKLENKVLGIDVSIWMYQIIKGVRESEFSTTSNKHLTIMFHRICKLLFFGIRPIFVFDGGVPELKKITIAQRQAQKSYAKKFSGKTKEKILKNMLEQAALKTVLNPGNTLTEDEVISKTINSLSKETEIDLFELPKLPESFELDKTNMHTKEREQTYLNSYNKTAENILLLAVENQDNDLLYSNSSKENKTSSPAKLNAFSSLQIGELLNGFSDDQKRIAERKRQQKTKREMTLNELEMFLNDNNETNDAIIDEFSQKIDSDYDTVFYYESGINNVAKSNSSKHDKVSDNQKTSDSEKIVNSEFKNTTTNSLATGVIGSSTPTKDIDEDLFKALVGNESLEEDKLAWLTFNENKKASKRRSSEHESPSINYSASNTNTDSPNYSEVNNDVPTEIGKNVLSIKHSSKSIFLAEHDLSNESSSNSSNDEECLSWSHKQDEPTLPKVRKKESSVDFRNIPSTSKSLSFIDEDDFSNKSDKDHQNINNSLSFSPNLNKSGKNDLFNVSPSRKSDLSDGSDNSLDYSTKESLSNDISDSSTILLGTHNEQEEAVTSSNKRFDCSTKIGQAEFKLNLLDDNTRIKSKFISNSTKLSKSLSSQVSPVKEQDLLSIQDNLVKHQNDLASLKRTYDQMASSITHKMTSDIKSLLRLFGIPYITAPMEAEAQCAFLEKIGCTEGTVTDDSDVWLFGANIVYKDFFDSHKFVKQFRSTDIHQKFALSQDNFIQLAFLVGSDYTNGIDGIGPVSAIEILSFIESKTKNMKIEDKLLKIKEIANSKTEIYSDIPFIKKLRSSKIGNDFPNKAVINAYLKPIVNESNEKFKWDTPQEDLIIQFAQKHFGWDVSKTKNTLGPVLKKVSERTKQKSLDSYVKTLPKLSNTNTGMSKRVSLAVKRLRNDTSSSEISNQKSDSPENFIPANSNNVKTSSKKRRQNLK